MTIRAKEVAKFLCGAEAFHTVVHLYFLLSGTTLTVLGIALTPALNTFGVLLNAIISLVLGIYAWGPYGHRSS